MGDVPSSRPPGDRRNEDVLLAYQVNAMSEGMARFQTEMHDAVQRIETKIDANMESSANRDHRLELRIIELESWRTAEAASRTTVEERKRDGFSTWQVVGIASAIFFSGCMLLLAIAGLVITLVIGGG